eukprot:1161811-Pelagomonas_calceolata.AAC.2
MRSHSEPLLVHPLVNTASLSMQPSALEQALRVSSVPMAGHGPRLLHAVAVPSTVLPSAVMILGWTEQCAHCKTQSHLFSALSVPLQRQQPDPCRFWNGARSCRGQKEVEEGWHWWQKGGNGSKRVALVAKGWHWWQKHAGASLSMYEPSHNAGVHVCCYRVLGREPIYVNFGLEPKIDKENPPDLAKHTVEPQEKPAVLAAIEASGGAAAATTAASSSKPAGQQAQVRHQETSTLFFKSNYKVAPECTCVYWQVTAASGSKAGL